MGLADAAVAGFWLALWGAVLGAILGAVFGLAAKFASGGRRDFSPVGGIRAERYEIVVDTEVAARAETLLGELADLAADPHRAERR